MLTEIAAYCDLNRGGLTLVEYAPLPWINKNEFPDYVNQAGNIDQDITFSSGTWLRCPFLLPSMGFEEPENKTRNGPSYDLSLTGITPGLRPEVSVQFERMSLMSFILRVKDRNGRQWILGNPFYPLRFSAPLQTGTEGALAAYTLTWAGAQKNRSRGFLLPA